MHIVTLTIFKNNQCLALSLQWNLTDFRNIKCWIDHIQYVSEKLIFYNLITWLILIQMISNFNSICRNNSKFYFQCVFFFLSRYRNTIHLKGNGILCIKICPKSWIRLCTIHLCENLQKMYQLKCRFGHNTKSSKRKAVQGKWIWVTISINRDSWKLVKSFIKSIY